MAIPPSTPFPKATPVVRGCGERSPGGLYVECGLSPVGRPFDDFLIDPPLPLLPGLDATGLANKPRFVRDPADGTPHLVIWIGAEHYPYVSDFVEEARRFGISRKLSPSVLRQKEAADLSLASRMLLVHPHVINVRWQSQRPPYRCRKRVPGHALDALDTLVTPADEDAAAGGAQGGAQGEAHAPSMLDVSDRARVTITEIPTEVPTEVTTEVTPAPSNSPVPALLLSAPPLSAPPLSTPPQRHTGPCLFKAWELLPRSAAAVQTDPLSGRPLLDPLTHEPRHKGFQLGGRMFYLRRVGSTEYSYTPTDELPDGPAGIEGLAPGIFGAFPITGFALVKQGNGGVNQDVGGVLQDLWDRAGVPWYEADQ